MKNKNIRIIIMFTRIAIAAYVSFLFVPWLFANIISGPIYTIVDQSKIDNKGIELIKESFDLYNLPDDVEFMEVKEELDHWFDPNITYHAIVKIPSNYINKLGDYSQRYEIKSISKTTDTATVEFIIYLDHGGDYVEKLLHWVRAVGTEDTVWRYFKSILILAAVIVVIIFPYHRLIKKCPKK